MSEADYEVLVHLSEAPEGRLRPYQLGRITQWEKSRLSHHLSRMGERGLVERQFCPTDNRGSFVAITESGRAAIAAAAPQHVEDVRRLFIDVLTPEQLDAIADIADTVLANLDGDDADDACS
jgi:DNA-binding MarR family transcriptional regulator